MLLHEPRDFVAHLRTDVLDQEWLVQLAGVLTLVVNGQPQLVVVLWPLQPVDLLLPSLETVDEGLPEHVHYLLHSFPNFFARCIAFLLHLLGEVVEIL